MEEANINEEFPHLDEKNRMNLEIERLKQHNKKLIGRLQNIRMMFFATLSFGIPLFIMLLAKGFLVIPSHSSQQTSSILNKASTGAQQLPDTVYLLGNPPWLTEKMALYSVSIGAFTTVDLNRFNDNLTANVRQTSTNGINQISLGLFDNEQSANLFLETLKKLGLTDAYVMKVKNRKSVSSSNITKTSVTASINN